jgi:serine/threonine protein kinase
MKPAEALTGLELDGGWHVDKVVKKPPKGTGGYSSVSYHVSNEGGTKAFLKALDFSSALQDEDPSKKLLELTSAYEHERNLLNQCKKRNLKHVVVPLAGGVAKVSSIHAPIDRVPYLIFEMAKGDIRNEKEEWLKFEQKFDLAWALRSLHQSAIGVQELHTMSIAHQDIKPSNVLVFPTEGSKLTDLGSASQAGNPSRSDQMKVAGDIRYAVPEQWYGWNQLEGFESRYLVDLYRLGGLLFFFFTDCSATDAIQLKISAKYGKKFVKTDFVTDLPYLQYAFEESITGLKASVEELAGNLTDEIVMIAQELCNPDPRLRGDPTAKAAAHRRQYDIQAYVSRFDRLATKAEMRMV